MIQIFENFTAESEFYPIENVWQSDFCEPYEWDTLKQMRLDILIHQESNGDEDMKRRFESWECSDENQFLELLDNYYININN